MPGRWLFGADEEEVGGDGAALEVCGGVPGGAGGVGEGDEVGVVQGAHKLHADVGFAEGCAVGDAAKLEGLRDGTGGLRVDGKVGSLLSGAVDRDLNGRDVRCVAIVQREVQRLGGAGFFGNLSAHDLASCLTAGGEADWAP